MVDEIASSPACAFVLPDVVRALCSDFYVPGAVSFRLEAHIEPSAWRSVSLGLTLYCFSVTKFAWLKLGLGPGSLPAQCLRVNPRVVSD